ncbi:MAG: ClpXP protease specificity-enhancing factor SspB [Pseudomonadales bacterium]
MRAIVEWILDSGHTPYILVAVDDAVQVPPAYVQDGRIVLNLSPVAIRDLSIGNDFLTFDGRFSGQSFPVCVPVSAILAAYARESGDGMLFEAEYPTAGEPAPSTEVTGSTEARPASREEETDGKAKGGHLKIVK